MNEVIMVIAIENIEQPDGSVTGSERYAVFSSPDKADGWISEQHEAHCITVPMVVDEPDHGNARLN